MSGRLPPRGDDGWDGDSSVILERAHAKAEDPAPDLSKTRQFYDGLLNSVMPAKAGIRPSIDRSQGIGLEQIPAFAGMT